jgi:hypothetical protein
MDKPVCGKCGREKSMYYRYWCKVCDRPEVETLKSLNFIQCLEHLEALGHEGIHGKVWDHFRDEFKNDSSFTVFFPSEDEKDEYLYSELTLIKKTWNIEEDSILMHVSW